MTTATIERCFLIVGIGDMIGGRTKIRSLVDREITVFCYFWRISINCSIVASTAVPDMEDTREQDTLTRSPCYNDPFLIRLPGELLLLIAYFIFEVEAETEYGFTIFKKWKLGTILPLSQTHSQLRRACIAAGMFSSLRPRFGLPGIESIFSTVVPNLLSQSYTQLPISAL